MPLQLCPSCARHVRENETRCPFCDASISFAPLARGAAPRLSRAAQMAFVAAVMVGCHEEDTKPPADPTTSSPPPISTIEPPPANTTTTTTTATATADAGPINPPPPPDIAKPYGAPPADGLLV